MAEQIVNPTSAAQLSPRNSEPSHLGGASWTDIGGRSFDGSGDADSYKVDGAAGISKDTSIPASVAAQPADKLSEADDNDEVEFEFDDDEKKHESVDDLDKALDEAGDFPETKVDVKTESDDEDEDDKDTVKEEADDDSGKPWEKKDKDKVDESDDDDEDDKDTVKEETEDDDEKKVDEADDDDDEDDKDKKVDESDDEDKDDKEKIDESLTIAIKMPKTALFESAGFNPKQQKAVAAVFESAIKKTTKQVGKQIHEHYRKLHVAKLARATDMLESRLSTYLDVVVEEWMKQNHVAVRQSVRTELAENFLTGLQSLFKEHYIDVPESKVDVVKKLAEEVNSLKKQVNEQHADKLKLRRLAEAANKKRIVAEFARNMSEAQAAKLEKLAEDTAYVSAKDFREKLTMLKESYFDTRPSKVTRLPEDDIQVIKEETGRKSEVDVVADAISRQVKSDW